ncbi:hypothetical protein DRN97_11245, partial [Methanosarcinales archaeon]
MLEVKKNMKKKKRSFMFCFIVIYFLLTLDVQVNSWNSETLEVLGNGEKYYSNTAEQLGNGNVVDIYRTINYSSSQKPDYIWENATDIVDVDGDGKLDILLGSRIYRNNYTTQELLGFSQKMLQNTSLNTAGAVVRIEISNGFVASVGYGDLNGDGMLDIVYIVRNGTTGMGYVGVFYINTTLWQSGGNVSSHNTRWIYIGNTTFANTRVRVVDVDGDGSNELLFLNYSTIYVFDQRTLEMEKNHTLSEAGVIIVGNNALRTVQLLDVDGDDDDDLLVGETNGVHIFRKETLIAGGKINVSEGELFVPGAVLPFYLAEVTQRGRTNLLIKKSYGESTIAVYILENRLNFSGNPVVNLDSIPHKKVLIGAHLNTLTISDVNNDDYDDLLFSMNSLGAGGKADVYLLLGGENLPSTVQGEFDGIFPGFRPAVSDFDGNGLKEVLLAQPYYQTGDTTGAIIGYEIIGTPPYDFSESLHYHVMITGTPEFCERDYGYPWVYQVMDLNKDGVDDLVVRCIGRVPALHVFLGRRPEPPQIVRVGDLSPVYRGETFKINIWVRDVHNPLFSMRAETEVGREGNWTEIRILSTRVKWDLENVSNSSLELKILVPQNMEPGRWDFRIRVFNTYNLSSDWYYMNGSLEVLDYDPVVYDFEIYPERLYVWEDMTISG